MGNYVLSAAVNKRILTLLMERYGCDIRLVTYPFPSYEMRLSTKLMAGDDDFDVYILYNESTSLIRSVIENSASVPLETLKDGAIVGNIDKMSPYVAEALHTEKGVLGIPVICAGTPILKAAPREVWEQYHLPYPDETDFSAEDYLDLCEKITQLDRELLVRTGDLTTGLLADFAEQYVREGDVDRDLLARVMDVNIQSYTTGGAYYSPSLDGLEAYTNGTLTQLLTYSEEAEEGESEDVAYIPYPYVEENTTYLSISAFACVNPASKKKKEAAEYLTCLSDEAYSRTFPQKSTPLYLYPNLADYTGIEHSAADEAHFAAMEKFLNSRTVQLRVTDERLIFEHPRWQGLLKKLGDGSVSGEEAAEEFLSMIRFMYME